MQPCLSFKAETRRTDRPAEFEDDISYPEELVHKFLEEYTSPGDVVLDPFLGFGTTLAVCEALGRRGLGIEILPERVAFVRDRLARPEAVLLGDARQLASMGLPRIDFSITSPPYMNRWDHPQNPLTGYRTLDGDYATYLREICSVYAQLRGLLKPGGRAVVNAANIKGRQGVTTLAWDLTAAIGEVLRFEREIVLCWDQPAPQFTNDYCLVFVNG
jgi:DNA modification methylase